MCTYLNATGSGNTMFLLGMGGAELESTLDTGFDEEESVGDSTVCGLDRAVCCVELVLGTVKRSSVVSRWYV